jgi:hypothetical protein
MDLNDVRLEHFEPLVGQDFQLENSDLKLKLLEVKTQNTRPDAARNAFALLFTCPVPATQGTYALHHEALGQIEVFLVPIKQDGIGVQLEAVFS